MAELRGGSLIAIILIVSGLDFLLFGYDQGLFGGILAGQGFIDMLGNPSPTLTGLVTAVYDIGCACGAVAAFIFGEKIGRKKSIMIANCIVIVGAAIQAGCVNYGMMIAARIIVRLPVPQYPSLSNIPLGWLRCRLFNSGRAYPSNRDSTCQQPWRHVGRSIRAHHHWRSCRFLVMLRLSLR